MVCTRILPSCFQVFNFMITLAQIGCGYWGPNLLRNFSAQRGCCVKWVAEQSASRRAFVKDSFPNTQTTSDWEVVIGDAELQAVIIATPAHTHYALVKAALGAGKHVFVEKPLATSTSEADDLVALAAKAGRTLMTGHTFLYNAAVRHIKRLLDEGEIG